MIDVLGGSQEHERLRAKFEGLALPDQQEDLRADRAMIDVALDGRLPWSLA